MKYIKKINELFLGGDKEPIYYETSKYFNPTTIETSDPDAISIKHQPDEIGKPDILKQKELILKASKIIGKKLSTYEKDRKIVTKEISDFIEANIDNKELSKEIDKLIDINKILKESKKCNLYIFDGLEKTNTFTK